MLRKIIAGIFIVVGLLFLSLSMIGLGMIWMYKDPLVLASITRLRTIDNELGQAQAAFQTAELELERTILMVNSAETSIVMLKAEFSQAKTLFGSVNGTLDKQLIPALKSSRAKIDQARASLQELRVTLEKNKALSLVDATFPGDKLLADLIVSTGSLDAQITQVEDIVHKASAFIGDASNLMDGDLTETKNELKNFLSVVQDYDRKLGAWRGQLGGLIGSLPGWIQFASIGLTVFLLWFGLSQFSLIIHGLTIWRGSIPQKMLPKQIIVEAEPQE